MQRRLVLCVDDERTVLDSLKEQLKHHLGADYRIEIAESGAEAIEVLEELVNESYEVMLIISDYIMPGMKGDELLKRIHETHPQTIKILLTGQATLEGVTTIINEANLYRFISKPWQSEDLILAVTEALKSYEKDRFIEFQNKTLAIQNMDLKKWVISVVEVLSKTLDTRDTTTSGHSKRMSELSIVLAKSMDASQSEAFKNVHFSENQLETLYFAALLHDVGKIGIRENILLKASRVSADRMALIATRWHWHACMLTHLKSERLLNKEELDFLAEYQGDLSFLEEINKKGYLTDDEKNRVERIGNANYADFEGNVLHRLDLKEMKHFLVAKGNLTSEELTVMQRHAELTYEILKDIPWPEGLSRVPELAASHHEKINGEGYYRRLKGEAVPIEARILAILDIYEALTSCDRPYSQQKNQDEAFEILRAEAEQGFLDQDILELMIQTLKQ